MYTAAAGTCLAGRGAWRGLQQRIIAASSSTAMEVMGQSSAGTSAVATMLGTDRNSSTQTDQLAAAAVRAIDGP